VSAPTVRDRVLDAVVDAVERSGLRQLAMEEVATLSGISRATLYRHFPGGREQLVSEAVTREVARFWGQLADAVRDLPTIEDRLVAGIIDARRRIDDNDLLQRLLASEPDDFLPRLFESDSLVHEVLRGYLRDLLERERLRPGVDLEEAADYVTRMLLSHVATAGRWDLADERDVRRLVRRQFLAGIVEGTDPPRV